jgi:hypothetical protein
MFRSRDSTVQPADSTGQLRPACTVTIGFLYGSSCSWLGSSSRSTEIAGMYYVYRISYWPCYRTDGSSTTNYT